MSDSKVEGVSQGPRREMGDGVKWQMFETWNTSDLGELQIGRATRKEGGIQDTLGVWCSFNAVVGTENSPANANSLIALNSSSSETARLFKVPVRIPVSFLLICYPPPHASCSQSPDQACQPQRNHISDPHIAVPCLQNLPYLKCIALVFHLFSPSSASTLGVNYHFASALHFPRCPPLLPAPPVFSPHRFPPTCFLSEPYSGFHSQIDTQLFFPDQLSLPFPGSNLNVQSRLSLAY